MTRSVARRFVLLALPCLLACSGCYSMYSPYGGYPSYQGGGMYPAGAPMQTLSPSGPYVPNSGAYPSTIPQGGTPTYQNQGLSPIPDASTNAPNYSPNPNNRVPSPYYQNGSTQFQPPVSEGYNSVQPAAMNEPMPLNPPNSGLRAVNSVPADPAGGDPFGGQSLDYNPVPVNSGLQGSADTFSPPRTMPSSDPFGGASSTDSAPQAMPLMRQDLKAQKVAYTSSSPFAHDSEYKWLRGVVSQEPQDGSWCIIYDDNPDGDDSLSGHLTLQSSPLLRQLQDGDIVEIHGELQEAERDGFGKPTYLVSRVRPVSAIRN